MKGLPTLPVSEALPELFRALDETGSAVLVAPPGAGKTTIVPLSLLDRDWSETGRIVLIVPRRIAARAAARRMASLIGENAGDTIGYAMRMENRSSQLTRILVVTEGVFTRMALADPELSGISAVIFDEFHERSLDGDFGLALALDIADALRPDLKLLVMSATLDAVSVSGLMNDAPIVESQGRSHPVEIRYHPRGADEPAEKAVAEAIRAALADGREGCLAFLPGQREISRTANLLADRVSANVDVVPLHGGLDGRAQDAAIRPPADGHRKVVLATAIAETSITVDSIDTVIDSGLARLPKYEPATGLTRLETLRVSGASADQRAGRAGRLKSGLAVRLWHEGQNASMPKIAQPEILEADLSGFLLDCAEFGVTDPAALRLLDAPPKPALAAARQQLIELGALDQAGGISGRGRKMRNLPLPVRLANMVIEAAARGQARQAAEIAVLLMERGLGGPDVDLDRRLIGFRGDKGKRAVGARKLADRIAAVAGGQTVASNVLSARLLLDACPDRVAKARGKPGHFLLANGRGAVINEADPLAREAFLVVADLQGAATNARIMSAASITAEEIEDNLSDRIERQPTTTFDKDSGSVRLREELRLGAIVLRQKTVPAPKGEAANEVILDAVRKHGLDLLRWDERSESLRRRLDWLHRTRGEPWPPMDDSTLLAALDDWLRPFLIGEPSAKNIPARGIHDGLLTLLPAQHSMEIDSLAPARFEAPTGTRTLINYEDDIPSVALRVQELYGLNTHPAIMGGSVPLKLVLLSPAARPIQSTLDLPGFWRGSWAEVRTEMKGRYPKHIWPERPQDAAPTTRAKPRGK